MTTPKETARAYWAACDAGEPIAPFLAELILWEGPQPVPDATDAQSLTDQWLTPLGKTFPVIERQFHILMAGVSDGRVDGRAEDGATWVGATGYLLGRPVAPFYGIPVADQVLRLRWGECLKIVDGKITQSHLLIDMIDWFEQVGRPVLPPSRGVPGVWPAPTAMDGIMTGATAAETAKTLALGRGLLFDGLNGFDETVLSSMGMVDFFHPNLKWYGPGGIGACFSFQEFEDRHQKPWLDSFPNRKVQDLALFAEGPMLGACGSAAVIGQHSGLPFRGSGHGQGQTIHFSGLDFWLRSGDVFSENWVFVDFIKLFNEMGIDLMDRMIQQ